MARRVSVVVPLYNAEKYVGEAISSILGQTLADLELIVVDDGSTDSSLAEARSFRDARIRVLRNRTNRGQAHARNLGFAMAKGDYVAMLDADDVACADRLAAQVAYLDDHPEADMVGSSYYKVDPAGAIIALIRVPCEPLAVSWRLLFGNPIGASTVMMRRGTILRAGGFDESIAYGEDMELWGRIAACGRIAQIDVPLAKYRVHPHSLTGSSTPGLRRSWERKVHRRNAALLAGVDVPDDVVDILAGLEGSASRELVCEAYQALERCAYTFVALHVRTRRERRLVFEMLLADLLRLARRSEAARHRAFRIALRSASRLAPESLLGPRFLKFAARVILPYQVRRMETRGPSC